MIAVNPVSAQGSEQYDGPIIDMHLHSYNADNYWGGRSHPLGITSPKTVDEHFRSTLKHMSDNNIVKAVMDGRSFSDIESLVGNKMVIPAFSDDEELPDIQEFERMVREGKIKVFGELMAVYQGKTLADPSYEPYLKICEEYGIPVAYHTGGGAPMTAYTCCPDFRLSLGNPMHIEDVLIKYPKLKIYLMHGGEVFYNYALRLMKLYPQLYLDLGVLLWVDPLIQDYAVSMLKKAKKANLLDRVMYGTDQMIWPGTIDRSINFLNGLDFLSVEEKGGIFYDNAARFLGLDENEISRHHK